jgi:copper resistance protein B
MNRNPHKAILAAALCSVFAASSVFAQDAMSGMDISSMQGGAAPANARSPDYSDGNGYGSMTGMDMHDDASRGMLLIDQLEVFNGRDANGVALDAQAWYGNDRNKLWLKADGERSDSALQDLRSEALWDHAVATYWDTQLGVRHDFGIGPARTWAAFGVQGLAPYWFDIEATAYVGPSGRTAARFEAEYDLRLTQRLIFQPDLEVTLYDRDDPERRIGSGLPDVEFGVRLRYEFHRQFAPYFGVDLVRKFGRTADFARAAGQPAFEPQLVSGVRTWF